MASSAGIHLLVYHSGRAVDAFANTDVYAVRIGPDGAPLDADDTVLAAAMVKEQSPAVAAGSNGFLVAWTDYRNPLAIQTYGAVLDASGQRTSSDDTLLLPSAPARVAGNGDL